MNYVVLVAILHAADELLEEASCLVFAELCFSFLRKTHAPLSHNVVKQLSSRNILHDQENMRGSIDHLVSTGIS